jgi:tetratricopeptide (TPR) repeat protein
MAHEHIVYMMLVDSATIVRDESTIMKYVPLLEGLARRDDHHPYLAIAHRARGVAHRLASEYEDAEAHLKEAIELFSEPDTRWQIGRTLYELGELELARSNTDLARDYFAEALEKFESLKATPDIARVNTVIRELVS